MRLRITLAAYSAFRFARTPWKSGISRDPEDRYRSCGHSPAVRTRTPTRRPRNHGSRSGSTGRSLPLNAGAGEASSAERTVQRDGCRADGVSPAISAPARHGSRPITAVQTSWCPSPDQPGDRPRDYAAYGRPRPRRATTAWPTCLRRADHPSARPAHPEVTGWVLRSGTSAAGPVVHLPARPYDRTAYPVRSREPRHPSPWVSHRS
jgi:hypothetical protein